MALSYAHGSIEWLTSTTAGNTYSVSGLSFQPKALMFWWVGIASGGSDAATESSDMRRGIGFATGTSARRCVASYDDDAALTSDSSTCLYNDCIAATHSNAAARDGALDLTAIASDGFTLTVDDQLPTGNITVFWCAWGGDDITVATVGDFQEPASAGDVSPTVTGFTSDGANQVLLFAGAQSTAAINTPLAENGGISFGVATGTAAANEWCIAGSTDHASGTTDTDGIGGTGKVVAQAPFAGSTTFVTANLSAWITDGFTVTYAGTVVANRRSCFLAMKGGSWAAGGYTINGNSGSATATVSGLPFAPKGIVIGGVMTTENTGSTGTTNDRLGIGFGTSTSSRRSQGVLNENGTASSAVEVDLCAEFDSVLCFPSTAGALQSAYDINAMNSDGFQIIVDTAGGVASEWQGYLAFSDTAITGTGALSAPVPTVSGSGDTEAPTPVGAWNTDAWAGWAVGAWAVEGAGASITGTGALTAPAATADGSGILGHVGAAALSGIIGLVSGAGDVGHFGSGALTAPEATVSATAVLGHTGDGSLNSILPQVSGSGGGSASITGTGALSGYIPVVSGDGTLGYIGSGSLAGYVPQVSGQGILGHVGSGSAAAPVPTASGSGGTGGAWATNAWAGWAAGAWALNEGGVNNRTGTGSLTAPAATLSGSGSKGLQDEGGDVEIIGVLPTVSGSATLSGAITGTGAPAAPIPTVSSSGILGHVGSGALTSILPVVSGSGSLSGGLTGSGALTAPAATLSGDGILGHTADDGISCGVPTVSASGVLGHVATGVITAPLPVIDGDGTLSIGDSWVGTGSLSGTVPVVSGSGILGHTGSGSLSAPSPTASGSGDQAGNQTGTGAISCPVPVISGSGILGHVGTGSLTGILPTMLGYSSGFVPTSDQDVILTGPNSVTVSGPRTTKVSG